MKKIILLLTWLVMFSPARTQVVIDKHINFTGKESIILNIQIADSIVVHTWNKKEVYAKASVSINDNKDNEAYVTSFDETGNAVRINARIKENYFKANNNCCTSNMIIWKLYIPENTAFSVETIDGNITIDGKTSEIDAKTISGFIDLKFSANRNADLKLKTISGKFYSDLDLASDKMNNGMPSVIAQRMNNGGVPVNLETISGNIYFRKSY